MKVNNVINLDMELTATKRGMDIEFEGGVCGQVMDKLSEDDIEAIKQHMQVISEIIGNAVDRDMRKELDKKRKQSIKDFADMRCKEIYQMMSDEDKKMVDKLEERLENASNDEERLEILFESLKETLRANR